MATLLVVVVMAITTWTSLRVVGQAHEDSVNTSGIREVGLFAAAIDPAWLEDVEGRQKLQALLAEVMSQTSRQGVLNTLVRAPDGTPLATGRQEREIEVSREKRDIDSIDARKAGVEIREFEYAKQPCRSFRKMVLDDRGRAIGQVEVLLSATQIEEALAETRARMVALSIGFSLGAAIVSFAVAAFVVRPIRNLARDLRQVSLGHLDHQSSVSTDDEVGDLARTFNQMTGSLREAQDLVIAQKATEHELNLATRIQQRLLPSSTPRIPGFEIASFYRSAREIGGDYFDFVRIDRDHLGIVVADVSGKGVPGSLVMTMTRSLLRLAAKGLTAPDETVRQINRALSGDMNPGMFVTLLYLILHIPTRRVRLVRAGHNNPIYFSAERQRMAYLQPKGIALGLDRSGALFDQDLETSQLTLRPGDLIVSYTDGIVEAKDHDGRDYGEQRFARQIRRHATAPPEKLIEHVIADVEAHGSGADQSDDITLVVLKFTGDGSR